MRPTRPLWIAFWCAVAVMPSRAQAQSVPVDSIDGSDEAAPAQPEIRSAEPKAAPVVTKPKPVATDVSYPVGEHGDHDVELDLTLGEDGRVEHAVGVVGIEPFLTHAREAALGWRFEPATRDGEPIRAKIRFLLRFTEPEPEPEPESTTPPVEAQAPPTTGPSRRPEKPIEVVVRGERRPQAKRLGRVEVRELPGAFGDPFRAIEVLPGVVPMMSGVPYFYVRGAPPGNVGYFFDGIPVPLLYHFAAGPGVLHPAFVENVDLYAAAYPARYGRFAGGIVAGEMAPPQYEWRGEGSVRLIDSGAMAEAPIAEGRGSVMVGGRYSYTALILSLIVPEVTLQYWDYQGRVRYPIDTDDSVEVFFFGSGDLLTVEEEDWEEGQIRTREVTVADIMFHRLDLRWDHELDAGRWRNAVMLGLDRTGVDDRSVLFTNRMVGARTELEQQVDPGVTLRTGADVLYERLYQDYEDMNEEEDVGPAPAPDPRVDPDVEPGTPPDVGPQPDAEVSSAEYERTSDEPDFGFDRSRNDLVLGMYLELGLDAGSGVEVIPGFRTDLFVSGNDLALGFDPRIAARFKVSDTVTLTHSLGIAHQMPSFVLPIPGVKPSLRGGLQRAVQHGAGVEWELPAGVHSSLLLFQSLFFNMTDFIGLARLQETGNEDGATENWRMTGRAYGAEVMLRRSLTRTLGGFVSYTISRSERFAGRLSGPATTDRTHVLNVALSYDLGRNWRFGNRFLVYSGIPARVAYVEAARHPPRTPPFWRIDWRLQKRWPSADGKGYWGFIAEVLNTTLNKEVMERSCSAYVCVDQAVGPVTIPSLGVEAAF